MVILHPKRLKHLGTLQTVYVDRGHRLKKKDRLPIGTLFSDMKRQKTEEERKRASRRRAIAPIIRYLESDHRLDRCYLVAPEKSPSH